MALYSLAEESAGQENVSSPVLGCDVPASCYPLAHPFPLTCALSPSGAGSNGGPGIFLLGWDCQSAEPDRQHLLQAEWWCHHEPAVHVPGWVTEGDNRQKTDESEGTIPTESCVIGGRNSRFLHLIVVIGYIFIQDLPNIEPPFSTLHYITLHTHHWWGQEKAEFKCWNFSTKPVEGIGRKHKW